MATIYDFNARSLQGEEVPFTRVRGNVLLIVNTASKCGFTPQYEGLEQLHETYGRRGLDVLGFPCNQFGQQEPGSASDIGAFCRANYGVSFPMFAKIDVNGPEAHPLYDFLTRAKPGVLGTRRIKWNFTKFLVDRAGTIVARFAPIKKPETLSKPIEALL